jgi:hypothetical protein
MVSIVARALQSTIRHLLSRAIACVSCGASQLRAARKSILVCGCKSVNIVRPLSSQRPLVAAGERTSPAFGMLGE